MVDELERRLLETIPTNMAARGLTTLDALIRPIRDLLSRQQFPEESLSDRQIEWLLKLLSSMDSDKDPAAARVGEREGRVASPLVERLSFAFNHGVGRSGHVTAPQPKAAGASLMQQLCNNVAVDAIRRLGLPNIRHGLVLPVSTGMCIALVFAALRRELGVRRVFYPRIDHKSPRRGLALAGVEVIEVPTILTGDAVRPNLDWLSTVLPERRDEAAVLATTTFFSPREPDPVKEIARLCSDLDTPLVINNAYGVQSPRIMAMIRSAVDAGRVDAVIQSSDKNFLAPVGGSILVSASRDIVEWTAATYAGRATAAPVVQTLAALLALGRSRYEQLRSEQAENRQLLETMLGEVADAVGQRLLSVFNPVSCAMTLDGLDARVIGARLYSARVTGPRAVEQGDQGSCIDGYPHSYVVMNAAIGSSREDVETAVAKLHKELSQMM